MIYYIKKITLKNISNSYLQTINHRSTKDFITYSKKIQKKNTKKDLEKYLKNLPKNEILYGIFKKKIHVANFKIKILKSRVHIGFLVFIKHQGKGMIQKVFHKIIKLGIFKKNNIRFIYLGVDKENLRAINLYKKLGFKYQKNSQKIMYININKI